MPSDALKDPYEFRVDALNATLTLGWEGETYTGNFWLKVEDTSFGELPTYDELANVPKIAHSTVEEFFGSNI